MLLECQKCFQFQFKTIWGLNWVICKHSMTDLEIELILTHICLKLADETNFQHFYLKCEVGNYCHFSMVGEQDIYRPEESQLCFPKTTRPRLFSPLFLIDFRSKHVFAIYITFFCSAEMIQALPQPL